jgi:uncharacterized membrane-anchored protein YhcB (DUF1043 family)
MEALYLIAVGLLAGVLITLVVARAARTARKTRSTLRRWARTRLVLTQTRPVSRARRSRKKGVRK